MKLGEFKKEAEVEIMRLIQRKMEEMEEKHGACLSRVSVDLREVTNFGDPHPRYIIDQVRFTIE